MGMGTIADQVIISEPTMSQAKESKFARAPLSEESIRRHLREQSQDCINLDSISRVHVFASVSSTNDYLLKRELDGEQFEVCVAEQQTRGRGRYGHEWVSPASANLYLSMLCPLQSLHKQSDSSAKLETLSLWLLIAIAKLLEQLGCTDIQLKWPNDLCVQNKKLVGLLIERKVSPTRNNIVIGIGLNVAMNSSEGSAIETPWIDLLSIRPDWQLSRNELAAKVVAVFYETLQMLEANQLRELGSKWKAYDMLHNKKVAFLQDGETKMGHVKGLDDSGLIVMDIAGELKYLHSAHISEIKVIGNVK